MFNKTDAVQLRESLPGIGFKATLDSNVEPNELLQTYRESYGLSFSQDLGVLHTAGTIESGQFQLVCHHFSVPLAQQRGTAFLLHGYFDHTGLYGHLIEHCLHQGFAVVIFDLPGHGLSSGASASISSFRQYDDALIAVLAEAARQEVNQPWIGIGQSTGAAVIIDSLLSRKLAEQFQFERLILLCPLLRPRNWLKSIVLFTLTRWFRKVTRRTFSDNSHDPEFLNFLKNSDQLQSQVLPRDWVLAMIDYAKRFEKAATSDQALNIIQGSGDETVDWQYNLPRLHAKFPASKIFMLSDAQHHLVNEAPEFRGKVFSLIDQIVAELS